MTIPLLLATWNRGKVLEMRTLLADLTEPNPATSGDPLVSPPTGRDIPFSHTTSRTYNSLTNQQSSYFEFFTLEDIGVTLRVAEDGTTYAENAARKAVQYCRASGILTLADDSGLEVDVLNGAPGLHSARYSNKRGASDADRRQMLLVNLAGKARPWTARFCCTVVIALPKENHGWGSLPYAAELEDMLLFRTEGVCEGEIIPEERGTNGFGYDPIFQLAGLTRTMAELTTPEKNLFSHRAMAVKAAIPVLKDLTAGYPQN